MAKGSSTSSDLSGEKNHDAPLIDGNFSSAKTQTQKTSRAKAVRQVKDTISLDEISRISPNNSETERSLLGAILMDNEVLADVNDKVKSADFGDPRHKTIFAAMQELDARNSAIDMLTLSEYLRNDKGDLKTIGGPDYISVLIQFAPPTSTNAGNYAEIIKKNAFLRKIREIGDDLGKLASSQTGDKTIDDLTDVVGQQLTKLTDDAVSGDLVPIENILTESYDRMEELHRDPTKMRGVKTGFRDLDKLTAGLQKSDLIILAARPAMGKSTFAQNIAWNIASKEKKSVLIFNLEMSNSQTVDRMLAEASGVDSWNIRTGNLTNDDFAKISEAMAEMSEAPIYMSDTPGINIVEMRTKARRQAHKTPLGAIVVDYLQLMSGSKNYGENRVQEISEISRGLKLIARELDVPVIALSQLSRSVESRPDKRPMLSDLRESGSIEQDADIVMFLYREDYYNPDTDRQHITELIIGKHRNGPTGRVDLYFHPERLKFMTLDKREQ